MKLIGLTGVAGAGKSTVAQYLVEQHGFTRLSFAAPLKKMLRTLNPILSVTDNDGGQEYGLTRAGDIFKIPGWTENDVKQDSEMGPEYRRLLQVLGTDCIRAVDEDFWVKAAMAQMDDPDGKYVFDDVRFPNEAEVIKHYHREGLWTIQRPGYEAINGHASEQHAGQMNEAYTIINDTDVERLHHEIEWALDSTFEEVSV